MMNSARYPLTIYGGKGKGVSNGWLGRGGSNGGFEILGTSLFESGFIFELDEMTL